MLVPMVVQRDGNSERSMDIYSMLLRERIIFLNGQVEDNMANIICASLLYLESQDDKSDIHLYINSPGGVVTSGLSIYDVMSYVKPDVATYVMGQACSMGSFLSQAGAPGKRFVLPNSRTMIHDPSGGSQGIYSDQRIQHAEMENIRKTLISGYVRHNTAGHDFDWFAQRMERDHYVSAETAVEYGLADRVIQRHELPK